MLRCLPLIIVILRFLTYSCEASDQEEKRFKQLTGNPTGKRMEQTDHRKKQLGIVVKKQEAEANKVSLGPSTRTDNLAEIQALQKAQANHLVEIQALKKAQDVLISDIKILKEKAEKEKP